MRRARAPVAALAGLLLMAAGPAARADVWARIDERGVAHFASQRLDDRYELFSRAAGPDEAAQAAPATAASDVAAPTMPSPGTTRLLAYIDASPGWRQARALLQDAARAHGLDEALLKAVVAAESGFDPAAVSPKGAIGLMQVMPATAERFGLRADARGPLERQLADPATNLRTGARYLRHLLQLFPGRLDLALAAYNAGEGAVQRAGQRIPAIRETQDYVRTVLQLHAALRPPAATPAPPVAQRAAPARPARLELPGPVPGRASMPPSTLAALPSAARPTFD